MNKNDEIAVYVLLFASLFLFVAASFPVRMFFPVLLLIVVASLPVWLALVILKRRGYPGPDEWGTKLIHILEKRQDTFFFRLAVFIASFFIYPAGVCQVWSYRLIGVRATYRWGHMKARPLAQIS